MPREEIDSDDSDSSTGKHPHAVRRFSTTGKKGRVSDRYQVSRKSGETDPLFAPTFAKKEVDSSLPAVEPLKRAVRNPGKYKVCPVMVMVEERSLRIANSCLVQPS